MIKDGDRIAQLVFQNVTKIQWNEVSSISSTDRSNQGFGSTRTSNINNNKMALVIKIDKRLIIDDNHRPSYQDLITAVNINNNANNISSQKEIDADFKINKADVIFKNSDFTPFQLGRNSLVETAVNDLAPNETDLPIKPTSIIQLQSDYVRKNLPIRLKVNTTQWHGLGTIQLDGQVDTGANTSAINNLSIIHEYKPFEKPQSVNVFLDEGTQSTLLTAEGAGYINIVSDQGNVMQWNVVYTPKSNGTILSPDNYHQPNKKEIFAFYQCGNIHKVGKIGFIGHDGTLKESITLRQNSNGQWLTTNVNRVLAPGKPENKFILQQVTTRSAQRQAMQQHREQQHHQE